MISVQFVVTNNGLDDVILQKLMPQVPRNGDRVLIVGYGYVVVESAFWTVHRKSTDDWVMLSCRRDEVTA